VAKLPALMPRFGTLLWRILYKCLEGILQDSLTCVTFTPIAQSVSDFKKDPLALVKNVNVDSTESGFKLLIVCIQSGMQEWH